MARTQSTLRAILVVVMMAATHALWADENSPLIVEAHDSLQWLRNEKQYIATGQATATQDDLTLHADTITAFYESHDRASGGPDAAIITHIKGETGARLARAPLTASADLIEYNIQAESIKASGGTPTIVNGQDTLKANDSITYDRKTRQIIALGEALVSMADGQKLSGNAITVIVTQDESDIITVTADGNVVVISPSEVSVRRAQADKMVYTRSDGLAILTGDVLIKDGDNIVAGDRAEMNIITGVSTISSGRGGTRVEGLLVP